MAVPPEQTEVAAFFRSLAGSDPVETHISAVFLGVDTVWKLKKSVRLSFLDFSTVDARRRYAETELALNQPHAPDLYRDAVAVVRRADGSLGFGAPNGAPVVDYVLRMARVPAGDFFDDLARDGRLTDGLLDALGDTVAAYHAALPPLIGEVPDMEWIVASNAEAAREAGLDPGEIAAWEAAALRALGDLTNWRAERSAAGFVRRGHGDLHLGNLCLWRGRPTPFDALEFNDRLAIGDLGYDLSFLLMDLHERAGRAAANRVLSRYVARTGDAGLVRGLPPFLSSRALIRAHVAQRSGDPTRAAGYLARAHAYLAPKPGVVVAIGGLPGSGKSTLARAIAGGIGRAPGAVVIRSDEIRKRLAGVAPEQRLAAATYTRAAGEAVFTELGRMARDAAQGGQSVIGDATFMDPAHRAIMRDAARAARVPFIGLWLTASMDVLEQRVAERVGDASDAGVAVLRSAARVDPGAGDWLAIDATNVEAAKALAIGALEAYL